MSTINAIAPALTIPAGFEEPAQAEACPCHHGVKPPIIMPKPAPAEIDTPVMPATNRSLLRKV